MRVRRQIRRIELWPLARVGLVFHLVSFATTLGAGVILYNVGNRSGLIDRFTSFLGEIGFAEDFAVDGRALLGAAVPAGLALVLLATVGTVLAGALYNVVSGLLGGLVISVIEDRAPIVRSVELEELPTGEPAVAVRTGRRLRRRSHPASRHGGARPVARVGSEHDADADSHGHEEVTVIMEGVGVPVRQEGRPSDGPARPARPATRPAARTAPRPDGRPEARPEPRPPSSPEPRVRVGAARPVSDPVPGPPRVGSSGGSGDDDWFTQPGS